jgi:hypothetical protein
MHGLAPQKIPCVPQFRIPEVKRENDKSHIKEATIKAGKGDYNV